MVGARRPPLDGEVLYTVHADRLQRRGGPAEVFPSWTLWPIASDRDPEAAALLAAVDARDGRVLALDQAAGALLHVDENGRLLARWSLRGAPDPSSPDGPEAAFDALPIDVAVGDGRSYVALGGRGWVRVLDDEGRTADLWPTRDVVRAIAAGRGAREERGGSAGAGDQRAAGDDLFVLGRGGWAYRHRADGRLLAAWPLPDARVEATDIAVDAAGRVLVSWARLAPARDQLEQRSTPLRGAGIWVFEPEGAIEEAPPKPEAEGRGCTVVPDKRATPAEIVLGETVRIELRLEGSCPPRPAPLELVLLLDASGSMAAGEADARARDAAMSVLAGLDPELARVGLVLFADTARSLHPLGAAVTGIAADLARVRPEGASRVAAGLREAAALWSGPPAEAEARRLVLLLSDGAIEEEPDLWLARDALREQGVALHALVFANEELDYRHRLAMRRLVEEPERLLTDPARTTLGRWLDAQIHHVPTRGLLDRVRVIDEIPPDMTYVPDSARPAATWDPDTRRLSWMLAARPGQPPLGAPSLNYALRPTRPGLRPTNVFAEADLTDALGRDVSLRFPLPRVRVRPSAHAAWLPWVSDGVCLRRPPPLDLVVALDTSRSMMSSAGEPARPERTRLDAARAAVRMLAEALDAESRAWDRAQAPVADPAAAHRLGVVTFDARARPVVPLVSEPARVDLGLASPGTASGTRIDLGLRAAGEMLAERGRDSRPVVLLLTDGRPDGGAAGAEAARRAAAGLQARRITLGFGPPAAVDGPLLRDLASRPGDSLHAPTEARLTRLVAELAGRLACPGGGP